MCFNKQKQTNLIKASITWLVSYTYTSKWEILIVCAQHVNLWLTDNFFHAWVERCYHRFYGWLGFLHYFWNHLVSREPAKQARALRWPHRTCVHLHIGHVNLSACLKRSDLCTWWKTVIWWNLYICVYQNLMLK